MINVTKTYLPPLEDFVRYLEKIWDSRQVTNNGPLVRELETKLAEYFGAKHVIVTANGTLALQISIQALGLSRRIITTPFSYVATTGAILWQNCTPVFVDIHSADLCIDPSLIEKAIAPDVEAILAVHVYGLPCDVQAIQRIARRHGLRVIYDAAHSFGSRLNGRMLATYGDVAVLSFHATKLFHTIEGGALVTDDEELAEKIRLIRAFGQRGDDHICLGINAKCSELHAAMGLCIMPEVDRLISLRKHRCEIYDRLFADVPLGRPISRASGFQRNYAYYPVLLPSEEALLRTKSELEAQGIMPRRYFYPALNRLPYSPGDRCPVAEDAATRVLCLPLSHELGESDQERISECIIRSLRIEKH